jgi:hypothetical protein
MVGLSGGKAGVTALRRLSTMALLIAAAAWGHDIPSDVKVQAYIKPEGQVLRLVVRAPLKAMRDIEFPSTPEGYLKISEADHALRTAAVTWVANTMQVYEGGNKLPAGEVVDVRVSLESDKSYVSYVDALAHVRGPRLTDDIKLPTTQGMLDVLLEYPLQSTGAELSIWPKFDRLGLTVLTVMWYLPPQGTVRAFEYHGDAGLVRLDPRWHQAALRFVESGFFHILDGTDHLLFLLCLVIPFRKFRPLLLVVTSFTVAHSITLIASAMNVAPGALWFPALIETLIAASIVYMALENIVGVSSVQKRWIITFGFGLVHGFGFSFALRETLQFAGSHLLTSLLAFNLGVELGQILVLVILLPALGLLFRYVVAERMGTIIVCAFVAHTAWHWMVERWGALQQYTVESPSAGTVASLLRWLMVVVAVAGAAWAISVVRKRRSEARQQAESVSR